MSWRTSQLKLALLAQLKTWVVDLLRGTFITVFKGEPGETTSSGYQGTMGFENDRVVTEIPFVLPYESIEEELAPTVDAVDTLATKCREQEFPKRISRIQQYARVHWHCVVAVPVRGRDSVLNGGQYLGDLLGEPRNRLPKTGSCMCGCKGWCSTFCVAEFVKWSCLAMTSGMWPTACHDGKLWRGDSDEARSQFAGTPLGSSA